VSLPSIDPALCGKGDREAGLIIVENVQVKYPEGKNVACQLRLDQDKYISGYQELAEDMHAYQARILTQILRSKTEM
jgi:2,4-dienoyl-CoA reductase-like NADH-dependent reductase (Old Yellow Enzyme family)